MKTHTVSTKVCLTKEILGDCYWSYIIHKCIITKLVIFPSFVSGYYL